METSSIAREVGSTDGSWKLTLAVVEPGNIVTIPVVQLPYGNTEPSCYGGDGALTFVYRDGHRQIWPLAQILVANYTPPIRRPR